MERQFLRYFKEAQSKPGVTGVLLAQLLERRIDNVVYRLNFAESRQQARQLVNHGHFTVNGRKVDIPSFIVKLGDVLAWKESSKQRDFSQSLTEGIPVRPVPEWLTLDTATLTGRVVALPEGEQLETRVDTRLIVEFYSR